MAEPSGTLLFASKFTTGPLDLETTWFLEGKGTAEIRRGQLALREAPESKGLVLWLRRDIPDDVALEFDVSFSNNRGIGVFFLAARGLNGEDILTDQPPRTGAYGEYTRGQINCYGASVHRFFPDGRQNDGCNLRRNAGFHIVHHSENDPITDAGTVHHVAIRKTGARIRMWVDDQILHDWTDDGTHGVPLGSGKIGFRIRGDVSCTMVLDNLTVRALAGT
jgi:hypothetical protein